MGLVYDSSGGRLEPVVVPTGQAASRLVPSSALAVQYANTGHRAQKSVSRPTQGRQVGRVVVELVSVSVWSESSWRQSWLSVVMWKLYEGRLFQEGSTASMGMTTTVQQLYNHMSLTDRPIVRLSDNIPTIVQPSATWWVFWLAVSLSIWIYSSWMVFTVCSLVNLQGMEAWRLFLSGWLVTSLHQLHSSLQYVCQKVECPMVFLKLLWPPAYIFGHVTCI